MQSETLKMAMLTVRNIPDEVHRALRVRAAQHGHSMEAEATADQVLKAARSLSYERHKEESGGLGALTAAPARRLGTQDLGGSCHRGIVCRPRPTECA